ncbi:MAG: hypothetical protein E7580_09000 [Ruminococcaceae bacterium]|nr:hypothetical protein [Oscillospiraceae bacterium]
MKKKTFIFLGVILFASAIILLFVFAQNYRVSKEKSYVPYSGAIDLYHASKEELIEMDLVHYSGKFGKVKNEKEAARIASKIIQEVYGDDETPYVVKYNEKANAWIVNGSLPFFCKGGVASVAIDKETGEILMMLHTK